MILGDGRGASEDCILFKVFRDTFDCWVELLAKVGLLSGLVNPWNDGDWFFVLDTTRADESMKVYLP